ncbi:DUF1707 domain-containing protein [Actinokineospora soli]|uniref:DUF1707 domain-containing protein n=1 Tax=Actinokineospora soli TaxID=1048753 RepID=A0ABW2TUP6_9PSEU
MGRDADIRVGTADRERAVALLSDHFTAGRIDVGEYEQRCAAATAARTRGEVLAVFEDLPEPHPEFDQPPPEEAALPEPAPSRVLQRASRRRANNLLIGGFVVGAVGLIVTVTAMTNAWWALAPALLIAAVLVAVVS